MNKDSKTLTYQLGFVPFLGAGPVQWHKFGHFEGSGEVGWKSSNGPGEENGLPVDIFCHPCLNVSVVLTKENRPGP